MKKKVNLIIISLMFVVMVWGIVASCLTLASLNPKNERARYDKDGKQIVSYDVSKADEYRYVEKTDIEIITRCDSARRMCKYYEILMKKAKEDYDADQTDAKLDTYNQATVTYKIALADAAVYKNTLFITSATVFFGTYFSIVVLLGIALLINQKIDYREKATS